MSILWTPVREQLEVPGLMLPTPTISQPSCPKFKVTPLMGVAIATDSIVSSDGRTIACPMGIAVAEKGFATKKFRNGSSSTATGSLGFSKEVLSLSSPFTLLFYTDIFVSATASNELSLFYRTLNGSGIALTSRCYANYSEIRFESVNSYVPTLSLAYSFTSSEKAGVFRVDWDGVSKARMLFKGQLLAETTGSLLANTTRDYILNLGGLPAYTQSFNSYYLAVFRHVLMDNFAVLNPWSIFQ